MNLLPIAVNLAIIGLSTASYAGSNAPTGESVFNKCVICHSTSPGDNSVGPTLFGIVGRRSGSVPGYSYSEAMKAANKTWDEAALETYVKDPKATVPGTNMAFQGLPNDKDRAKLIAYLATLK